MNERKIVLVGGGHAHVEVVRRWPQETSSTAVLINPDRYAVYSGMIPGLLAGHYRLDDCCIDLQALCRHREIEFILDEVAGISTDNNELILKNKGVLQYDIAALDIGSVPTIPDGSSQHMVCPAKPVMGLWQGWKAFLKRIEKGKTYYVNVVGAGVAGVEVVLAMQHRLAILYPDTLDHFHFKLMGRGEVVEGHNHFVKKKVLSLLQKKRIEWLQNISVRQFKSKDILCNNGLSLPSDLTVICTSAKPNNWLAHTDLPLDNIGFISVNEHLLVQGMANVFATGDTASFSPALAKAGVYPVRQGPVLSHNIQAQLREEKLQPFMPQTRFLSLIATGDKKAIASRGPAYAFGRVVWFWKNHIDRSFMKRYQQEYQFGE